MSNLQDIYMNPQTGSKDTLKNWKIDYAQRENHELEMTWVQWGGDTLVKVQEVDGEWVAA